MKKSKKKRNLILVSRPINFLYALEICHYYQEEKFLVLIFANPNQQEKKAIEFLRQEIGPALPNAEFQVYKPPFSSDLLNLIAFYRFSRTKLNREKFKILSTSGGVKGRMLFKNLSFEQLIITDEGASSLTRFPRILREKNVFSTPMRLKLKVFYKMLNIYDLDNDNDFMLWTMYEELLNGTTALRANDFPFMRKYISENEYVLDKQEVIVLGANPEHLNLTENQYREHLQEVFQQYQGKKIYLKPHKLFPKSYDFPELETELPIEYLFLKRKKIPAYLLSFNSTSSQIMQYLFPEVQCEDIIGFRKKEVQV